MTRHHVVRIQRWWKPALMVLVVVGLIIVLISRQSPEERVTIAFADARDAVVAGDSKACAILSTPALTRANALARQYGVASCESAVTTYGERADIVGSYALNPQRVVIDGNMAKGLATTPAGVDGPTIDLQFVQEEGQWKVSKIAAPATAGIPSL